MTKSIIKPEKSAESIAVIGGSDGPTSVFLAGSREYEEISGVGAGSGNAALVSAD